MCHEDDEAEGGSRPSRFPARSQLEPKPPSVFITIESRSLFQIWKIELQCEAAQILYGKSRGWDGGTEMGHLRLVEAGHTGQRDAPACKGRGCIKGDRPLCSGAQGACLAPAA